MQYRISTLVALFSATTALAYLDCGGGRAPPKTTVPGCPGYVDPATAVPTSTALSTSDDSYTYVYTTTTATPNSQSSVYTTIRTTTATPNSQSSVYTTTRTTTASSSHITDQPEVEVDANQYYTMYEDLDAVSGCNCRGYLCQYATAGCVNLDASSTITANPGWETQSFDPESYYSYIRTASSAAGGELSIDGYRIELVTAIPSSLIYESGSKTQQASTTATGSATGSGSTAAATTITTSTISASSSQAASNSSSNGTASATGALVASTNSASTISGMASMAALLISGAAAIVML